MKKHFFRIIFLILTVFVVNDIKAANVLGGDTAFIRTYGGVNFEEFRDIVQTPDSGFLMCGITNGYGQGSNAIYVVKTTKTGEHEWSKAFGGVSPDLAYSVAINNSGNYFIAGTSSSGGNGGYDGYLICLDVSGTILWEKYYGGSDWDFIYSVEVMPDQSILLAGESYSFSNGGTDAWVLHLNSSGDTTWTNNFGSTGNDAFKNICQSPTAIYLSGYIDSTDADGMDGYLIKLDLTGNFVWEKRVHLLGRDLLNGCTIDQSGDLIAYGSTAPFDSTKNDALVTKLDTNGTVIWSYNSASGEDDDAKKIIPISNNELFLIGQKNPSGNGAKSIFMTRYNSSGFSVNGGQSFGGPNDEEGYSMINTIQGGVAIVGYTSSYGLGNSDALLVYLNSDSSVTAPVVYSLVSFTETLSPIGIEETNDDLNFSIYPNPTSGVVTIQIKDKSPLSRILVYDLMGKCVNELKDLSNSEINFVSLTDNSEGVYFIKIEFENGSNRSFRILKVK
ncbi:MAG: T9SS type A sorting domain-containing protein [Bacteroidetes bacterium]|nr:T9SS type A sorting domain-containing protein [Bacteroidota bacterium]